MSVRLLRVLMIAVLAAGLASAVCSSILLKPNGQSAMPLRTKSISADVEIDRQFATTDLTMVFQNETHNRIEADFMYTLPLGAVVTYFAYWYGKEKVVARVVEKQRAAQIYQHITSRMRDPALIELIGKNLFRARIFPVMPDADLKVQMVYVQTLPSSKGGVVYTLPLADAGKEKNALDKIDVNVLVKNAFLSGGEGMPPPPSQRDNGIKAVTTNFGIPVTKVERGWRVSFSGTNYRPQKDMSIRLLAKENKPLRSSLYAARSGGPDGFLALALTPDHSLASPTLKISGVRVYDMSPAKLPSIKAGQTVFVFGRYRGYGAGEVTLAGKSPNGPLTYKQSLQFGSNSEPNNPASKLWAARKIEQLSAKASNRSAVIAFCTRFTLPSKFASWLAIPKEERARYKREIVNADIDRIAEELAPLVASGKGYSPRAKALKARLSNLCKQVGRDPGDALREGTNAQTWKLGRRIADLVVVGKGHSRQASDLKRQLESLCKQTGRSPSGVLQDQLSGRVWDMGLEIADIIAAGRGGSKSAQARRSLFDSICEQTGYSPSTQIRYAADERLRRLADELVMRQYGSHWDNTRLEPLMTKMRRLAVFSDYTPEQHVEFVRTRYFKNERDNLTGMLYSEANRQPRDDERMKRLREQIRTRNTQFRNADYTRVYDEYLDTKLELQSNWSDTLRAQYGSDATKVEEARQRRDQLQKQEETLFHDLVSRWGDPLISIEAPADALQVTALMPDGEVKALKLNPDTGKWEGRFDIPTYAKEGSYVITIVIVTKDGTRKVVKFTYKVDVTAPNGKPSAGIAVGQDRVLRLELAADGDTARVAAMLPWNERVELKPGSQADSFFALVPIPEGQSGACAVTFVLTDKAHNRTTLTLDVAK